MNSERSLLNWQYSHTIITQDDYSTYRNYLNYLVPKEIFNKLKKRAEDVIFFKTFDELCEDIFYSYYNRKLDVRTENYIKLKFLLNHTIINNLMETEIHKERRTGSYSTVHSETSSFQALFIDIEEIFNKLDEYLKPKQKNELKKLSEQIYKNEEDADKYGDMEGDTDENNSDELLKKELDKWLEKNKKEIKDAVNEGIEKAKEQIEESENLLNKVLGGYRQGNEEGVLQKIPIHKRIELAKQLSNANKMKEIIEYLGRFRVIAQKKKIEKLSDLKIEPTDVTTGGNVSKAIPSELAKLGGNKVTRTDFLIRWSNNDLLIIDPPPEKEKENLGKGSIIICVDTSGSMSGIKEYKSKALALAVAEVAYQQGRNFACILFDTKFYGPIIIKPDDNIDTIVSNVISIAQDFYRGGTNFEPPLEKAMEIIENDEFNNADILFLTDGFASIGENFLNEYEKIKKEKQFKTVGLLLDASDVERDKGKTELEKFCDDIKYNSSIENDPDFKNSEDIANDIFFIL